MADKRDIRDCTLEELTERVVALGEKAFRARQAWQWLWQKGVTSFEGMTNLSRATQAMFAEHFEFGAGRITRTQESADGTTKLGMTLPDGAMVECVLIPAGERATACVSSQAGCRLGCAFCATGGGGFVRDLRAWEIFDQVMAVRRLAEERGGTLTNVVFMGMGEPLLNYDNVWRAIERMTGADGLAMSPSRLTLSTAGIPEGIRRLADDGARFHLAVSLHSAVDGVRGRLMPVNRAYPLARLAEAIRYFVERTGTRPTFEYLLLRDVNDSLEDARALALYCRQFPVKINLIEYNEVEGLPFRRSPEERRDAFARFLEGRNMVVNVRRSRGRDIDAACGQLVNKQNK